MPLLAELGKCRCMRPGPLGPVSAIRPWSYGRPRVGGRDACPSTATRGLLDRFLLDHDLQMRGDVFMQLHWHHELAQRLQRLMNLDLTAVDVEAFLFEGIGKIA